MWRPHPHGHGLRAPVSHRRLFQGTRCCPPPRRWVSSPVPRDLRAFLEFCLWAHVSVPSLCREALVAMPPVQPGASADDCVFTHLLRVPAFLLPPANWGLRFLLSQVCVGSWGEVLVCFILSVSAFLEQEVRGLRMFSHPGSGPEQRRHCILLGPVFWTWVGAVFSQV